MMLAGRMSYPAFAFVSGTGEIINVSRGFLKPNELMPLLENIAGTLAQK